MAHRFTPRAPLAAALALLAMGIPALSAGATKETERVERTVPMQAGGTVTLKNFSGRVEITGEARSDVAIVAIRKATRERLDRIKLDIQSDGRSVTIEANKRDKDWQEKDDNVVETDFTIKVPQSANLDLKVFSSPVQISGVAGTHKVHGFSSDLRLDEVTGPVDAETFSGQIYLAPATWQQGQSVRAKTFSGDIEVRLPDGAAGTVEFDSFSGDVDSAVVAHRAEQIEAHDAREPQQRRRRPVDVQDIQRGRAADQVAPVTKVTKKSNNSDAKAISARLFGGAAVDLRLLWPVAHGPPCPAHRVRALPRIPPRRGTPHPGPPASWLASRTVAPMDSPTPAPGRPRPAPSNGIRHASSRRPCS